MSPDADTNAALKLHVITASTRPERKGRAVAEWFLELARRDRRFHVEDVDLREVGLPLFDEPRHPRLQDYAHDHTKAWSAIVDRADAFVVVTPEYDHGPPSSLVNALQFLVKEWGYKPMGFVSYGGVSGGTRSTAALKPTVVVLRMMPVVEAVNVPFFSKLLNEETGAFEPGEVQEKAAAAMLDELARWGQALRELRAGL